MSSFLKKPTAETGMLIRKPVEETFEAFADPAITTKFWFTKSSGRLESGSAGGFCWVLAGCKAYLEYKIQLNLVEDRFPKGKA